MRQYKMVMASHPLTGKRIKVQEHVMIWLLNQGLWQRGTTEVENGYVIHHVDFNPRNNDPSNLALLTYADHNKLHWEHDEERRKRVSASLKRNYASKTPEEKAARIAKARIAAAEKVRLHGPTDAQKENMRKARSAAYGGRRFTH